MAPSRLADALRKQRHFRGERVLWRADGYEKVTQVLLGKWMSRIQRLAGHQYLSTTQRYMKREAQNGNGLETQKASNP